MTDISNNLTGTTVLSKFDYTYNAVGTIATKEEQADSNTPTIWNYQYDRADQIKNAVKTNTSTGAVLNQDYYGYDLAGNRLTEQQGLSVTSASFNNLNQTTGLSAGGPLQFTGTLNKPGTVTVGGNAATMDSTFENFAGTKSVSTGTNNVPVVATSASGYAATNTYQVVVPSGTATTPTYDNDGNLTSNGSGQTYTWDAENELTTITYTGGATSNFTYDALGRRLSIIEKNSSGTVTSTKQFVWVGSSLAEERDATNTVTKRFYAQGEQISGSSYYYTRDSLGSVREMTNSSGTLVSRLDYDPWGRVTIVSGTTLPDMQYAGYYAHGTSGLNLTWFRAYDPNTGKWLSRDPLKNAERLLGPNLYEYVGNNPIYWVDPLGLYTFNAGFSFNIQVGPVNFNASVGVVFDTNGNVGGYVTQGAGPGAGVGAAGGVTVGFSDAGCIQDLAGPFTQQGVSGGDVVDAFGETYQGSGAQGQPVTGFSLTGGGGAGAQIWAGTTNTQVYQVP